jgi:hypothetical protein
MLCHVIRLKSSERQLMRGQSVSRARDVSWQSVARGGFRVARVKRASQQCPHKRTSLAKKRLLSEQRKTQVQKVFDTAGQDATEQERHRLQVFRDVVVIKITGC